MSPAAEFTAFFRQEYPPLLRFLVRRGVRPSDAEDVAQAAFTRVYARWADVKQPRAFLYRVAKNEVAALARRHRADRATTLRWAARQPALSTRGLANHRAEVGVVCDSLAILPPRQREIMARICTGDRSSEIAAEFGVSPSTVRSQVRHARRTLRPLCSDDWRELRLRVGERQYGAWHRGERLPVPLRPVIEWAWEESRRLEVDPEHGAAVKPLAPDEIRRRRQQFLLASFACAVDQLVELGRRTGMLAVIGDGQGVILWEGGPREMRVLADRAGFVEGARWDMEHAGGNGLSLSIALGCPVAVCRFEHFVQAQHGLSCIAVPLHGRDGRLRMVLNLTGDSPVIHPAIAREIELIAHRLQRQLRAS